MLLSHKIGLSHISVQDKGFERDPEMGGQRPAYEVIITTPKWQYIDGTVRGGVGEKANVHRGFGAWLSFLMACVESQPNGENANLFPAHVVEWASAREWELMELDTLYNPDKYEVEPTCKGYGPLEGVEND